MSNPKDGGPAFPAWELNGAGNPEMTCFGMSLRDYFAAKALQGLLANPKLEKVILKEGGARSGWIESSAFAFADAMIAERRVAE